MSEKIIEKGEVVDTIGDEKTSSPIFPQKVVMKNTSINEIELYKDDTDGEKILTKKQKLEDQYNQYAITAGYESMEQWYAAQKWELANKEKLTKEDDLRIKLLQTIAADMGYNDNNKEFVIGTGIKQLTNQRMLNR